MTLLSPSLSLPTRQIIVKGRAFVRLTETPLDVVMAALSFTTATNAGKIATTFITKPGGHYALHCDPSRGFPDFTGAGDVTLNVLLTFGDTTTQTLTLVVSETDALVENRPVTIAGQDLHTRAVTGAPFDLSLTRDPVAVTLKGQVLVDGDITTPAAAFDVSIDGGPPQSTDIDGFFTATLPIALTANVTITKDADSVTLPHTIDFSTSQNTAIFAFRPDLD